VLLCVAIGIHAARIKVSTQAPHGEGHNNIVSSNEQAYQEWVSRLKEASSILNGEGATEFEWGLENAAVVRLCCEALTTVVPAIIKGSIGGFDLSNHLQSTNPVRVWEKIPQPVASWTTIRLLQKKPCIAVKQLELDGQLMPDSMRRCQLVIPVQVFQRFLGPLRERRSENGILYCSEGTGSSGNEYITVSIHEFDETARCKPKFVEAAMAAADLEWDQVYVPVERLESQGMARVGACKPFRDLSPTDITLAEAVCYARTVESTKYVGVLLEL
jgi:hypothetical protein